MLTIFLPIVYPALGIDPDEGSVLEQCIISLSKTEPAFRYASLLFAAGHFAQLKLLAQPERLRLRLQRLATEAVLEAFMTEKRRSSEGLILGIGALAFYESMFGDPAMAHEQHRPAQSRLVESRGGLQALNLPTGMSKLMLWSDAVMAWQSESKQRLLDVGSSLLGLSCDWMQCLQALRLWLPEQYADLICEVEVDGRNVGEIQHF